MSTAAGFTPGQEQRAPGEAPDLPGGARPEAADFRSFWFLIGAGWLLTNLGYKIAELPMQFFLKEQLGMQAQAVALFFFVSQFTNYIKPLAGITIDALPLFGTRRRHYLLIGLAACGVMWLVLGWVPRSYAWWLGTYTFLHIFIVLISTTLGGVMVEGGERYRASGRLSAQRVGVFRIVGVVGGPLGGLLASYHFGFTGAIVAGLHLVLVPFFWRRLSETRPARTDTGKLQEMRRQWHVLLHSRTLWRAAGLVCLVMAAPGFSGVPLLFFQSNVLKFSKEYIGFLEAVEAASGVLGAILYTRICGRFNLRPLLVVAIVVHAAAALLYLGYTSRTSALVITALYFAAQTVAVLPLYDLAIRATPKGSEALGYSVMMSVWNLTIQLSNLSGSWLVDHGWTFANLVWLNSGTTILVLLAVRTLPHALTQRREGEAAAMVPEA